MFTSIASVDGVLPNLRRVEGNLRISQHVAATTLGTGRHPLPSKRSRVERRIRICANGVVATLGASFSSLVHMGRDPARDGRAKLCERLGRCSDAALEIINDPVLTTLGTAFASLRQIHGNIEFRNPLLTNFEARRNLECHNGVRSNSPSTNCVNCPDWLLPPPNGCDAIRL